MKRLSILLTLLLASTAFADDGAIIGQICKRNDPCYSSGFKKCEDYYRIESSCPDLPEVIYDGSGNQVAECGGMPLPGGTITGDNDPKCKIPCGTVNQVFCNTQNQ